MLELSAPEASDSNSKFNFLSFEKSKGKSVVSVNSHGDITTSGGAKLTGAAGLFVAGPTTLQGSMAVNLEIMAAALNKDTNKYEVIIPATSNYVTIGERASSSNSDGIVIKFSEEVAIPIGRIVILTNSDAVDTAGAVEIPPKATIIVVYNGKQWVDVEALKAPIKVIHKLVLHSYIYS